MVDMAVVLVAMVGVVVVVVPVVVVDGVCRNGCGRVLRSLGTPETSLDMPWQL